MISRPPRRRGGDRGQELAWSGLFLLASLAGALAAADITRLPALYAVLVSVLVTGLLILLMRYGFLGVRRPGGHETSGDRSQGTGPDPADQRPAGHLPPDHLPPDQRPADRRPADQPDHIAAVRLLRQPEPSAQSWWRPGQTTPEPARERAPAPGVPAEPAVAPKLSSYLDSALIAQCPNCGSFRLDTDQRAPQWRFRCQECQYVWDWQPGQPWPALKIRPQLRRERQPPPPQRG